LEISEKTLERLMEIAFNPSRVARVGKIDLKPKRPKEMLIEGYETLADS